MIVSTLNLDNLKARDFTADVDFSNVKVEMIGGLPTFIPLFEIEYEDKEGE